MVVPFSKGLSESLKKACSKHGVQVYFKGGMTIKSLFVAPRIKIPSSKKVESYRDINVIGWSVVKSTLESSRTFEERFKEHQKAPSQIYDHYNTTGHTVTIEKIQHSGEEGPEPH